MLTGPVILDSIEVTVVELPARFSVQAAALAHKFRRKVHWHPARYISFDDPLSTCEHALYVWDL